MFNRVVIVGVGLLGGSLGLALKQRGLASKVIGVGRSDGALEKALKLNAIDRGETSFGDACVEAELVVVCTPVQTISDYLRQALAAAPADAILTDVGSTKAAICGELDVLGAGQFCGSHPLAGSEKGGVEFADGDLFRGRQVVLTPGESTGENVVRKLSRMWEAVGAKRVMMTAGEHDAALARTSHLPHLLASALAASTDTSLLPLAASGWCDTTRIAAGGIDLWRQILLENRKPVLDALQDLSNHLDQWKTALEMASEEQLTELLQSGKQQRDSVAN